MTFDNLAVQCVSKFSRNLLFICIWMWSFPAFFDVIREPWFASSTPTTLPQYFICCTLLFCRWDRTMCLLCASGCWIFFLKLNHNMSTYWWKSVLSCRQVLIKSFWKKICLCCLYGSSTFVEHVFLRFYFKSTKREFKVVLVSFVRKQAEIR